MKKKIKLLSLKPLKSGKKKYIAEFQVTTKDGKKSIRNTKFGAKGMSDYTIHKDIKRRNRYIKRHIDDLRTNDPTRAGFLSMYVLWNKKTFKASLADYKRRLNIYNKTGKFPRLIPGSSLKSKFGNQFGTKSILKDPTIGKSKGKNTKSLIKKNILFKPDQNLEEIRYYDDLQNPTPLKKITYQSQKTKNIKPASIKKYTNEEQKIINKIIKLNEQFNKDFFIYEDRIIDNYSFLKDDNKIHTLLCILYILKKMYKKNIKYEIIKKFIITNRNFVNYYKCEIDIILELIEDNYYIKSIINEFKKIQDKKLKLIAELKIIKDNNSFGRVYLYPFLVDKTRFRDLPPDIIQRIEEELQISDIINQYKSYRDKKQVFKLITNLLGERLNDNQNEYIFDWDPSDEQSVEWLYEASKLLTKKDLSVLYWKEAISNFIVGFAELGQYPTFGSHIQYQNYELSEKYIIILLNKVSFNPPINLLTDETPFYDREDILEYFNIISENNYGKNKKKKIKDTKKSKAPDNVKNPKLYLKIKAKIQKDVKAKNRRWGAYDSGRLVREYKQSGGKYSGTKVTKVTKKSKTSSIKSSNLDRWYREKWIDACAWPKRKSCGRTKASIKSKVTYCRPSKVIDSNTPKTVQELTKAQIKKRCAKKSKNPKKIIRK